MTLLSLLGIAWTLVCLIVLATALIIWRQRRGLAPYDGFFVGGMMNFAVAPYVFGVYGELEKPSTLSDGFPLIKI